jgi:hypothetical protein
VGRKKQTLVQKIVKSEDMIIQMVSDGISVSEICKGMSISRNTFYNYLNNNIELKNAYELAKSSFSSEFRSNFENLLVGAVTKTMDVDVMALREMGSHSRWLESHCNSDQFGEKAKQMMKITQGDTEVTYTWETGDGSSNDTV